MVKEKVLFDEGGIFENSGIPEFWKNVLNRTRKRHKEKDMDNVELRKIVSNVMYNYFVTFRSYSSFRLEDKVVRKIFLKMLNLCDLFHNFPNMMQDDELDMIDIQCVLVDGLSKLDEISFEINELNLPILHFKNELVKMLGEVNEIIERNKTIHKLKTLPEFFEATLAGEKPFEIRKNDRGFQKGDLVILKEFDGENYTGRQVLGEIIYVTPYGQIDNHVVFSYKRKR
ncbi:DUF3850 domain-containing protein [Enterococcus wangshanyuanii]|uniref:DUF3850 domain-containing protein n=1 Tax=Enterococcus wangshanyuanii TaxID=2005703 RepID=A0ABQ1PD06_9ENTE|nr:DUF3850 domain-containing protein [Enterococcus wangshanyuanii]MTD40277.1 DUF3850 domain-containing protein [Erwinia sp. CPCC 100877]GGC94841.1 hypothetical protein GCM10011573_25600 [Enterococcus wangshanyuanii]